MPELAAVIYILLKGNGRVIIFNSMSNDDFSVPVMSALDTVYLKSVVSGKGMIYRWVYYENI